MMKDGMKKAYERSNVYLIDNTRYDEYGAILLVSTMILRNAIAIDVKCQETSRQMNAWCVEGKDPGPGFGLARALCNMVSMLWESGKMEKIESKLMPYTRAKEQFKKNMDQADSRGRLTEFLMNKQLPDEQVKGADGWMGI